MEPDPAEIDDWRWLMTPAARPLLGLAQADPDVRTIEQMRRLASPTRVRLALALSDARRRARGRLDQADDLACDPEGVQMASTSDIARWKADRIASQASDRPVIDCCSGIGGDAMMLGQCVGDLACVEMNPVRAWMCAHNTELIGRTAQIMTCDVRTIDAAGAVLQLDPQRRGAGRRSRGLESLQPDPDTLAHLVAASAGACVKLAPGIDPERAIERLAPNQPAGVEFISRHGRLAQAIVWTGVLHDGEPVRATMIDGVGKVHTIAGRAQDMPCAPVGAWIHSVDPCIERGSLLGLLAERLGVSVVHPSLGLLTSDGAIQSPWVTSFRVLDVMPWREQKVRARLREMDAGLVEVKTRAGVVDPDRLQTRLRGEGSRTLTVFVLRMDEKVRAIIARRVR